MTGEALHNAVTGAPDMWAHLKDESRAGWAECAADLDTAFNAGECAVLVMHGGRLTVETGTE